MLFFIPNPPLLPPHVEQYSKQPHPTARRLPTALGVSSSLAFAPSMRSPSSRPFAFLPLLARSHVYACCASTPPHIQQFVTVSD